MGVSFPLLVIVLGLLVCLSRVASAGHSGWPVKIFVLFLGGHDVTPITWVIGGPAWSRGIQRVFYFRSHSGNGGQTGMGGSVCSEP